MVVYSDPDVTFKLAGIPLDKSVKFRTTTLDGRDGIPYVTGMPLRREFSSMIATDTSDPNLKKQWTLYVLATEQMMSRPVDDKLSYFQIAGIHGYPETTWDNAPAPQPDPQPGFGKKLPAGWNPFGGYCQHNTVAFGTWHRPYMLLYEQVTWLNMKDIVNSWGLVGTESHDWMDAADTWRLPYYDWARLQPGATALALPSVFTTETIAIYPPDQAEIDPEVAKAYRNPFWKYTNPEINEYGETLAFGSMPKEKSQYNIKADVPTNRNDPIIPWDKCTGTSRHGLTSSDHGKTWTGLEGINNWKGVNAALDKMFFYGGKSDTNPGGHDIPHSLPDGVNRLFDPVYDSWGDWVSTKWFKEKETTTNWAWLSLEYIHNNVHNDIGGYGEKDPYDSLGHMLDVPVSAYDPIFWPHHCNIDRVLAMWQALNYTKWWNKAEDTKPGIVNEEDIEPTDQMPPFHTRANVSPQQNMWRHHQVRDWTQLRYQYDDLMPSSSPDSKAINSDGTLNEAEYRLELAQYIQKTYPNTSHLVHAILKDDKIPNDKFLDTNDGKTLASWDDYIINVVYDRHAFGGHSYSIQFYLGGDGVDKDTTFAYPENFVGKVYTFGGYGQTSAGRCANCTAQASAGVLSKAQVPITSHLIRQALDKGYTHVDNTKPDDVAKYLAGHLHWRYIDTAGREQPAKDFPSTKISVWSGTGTPVSTDDAHNALPPSYGNYVVTHDATHGKPGGVRKDDPVLGTNGANGSVEIVHAS